MPDPVAEPVGPTTVTTVGEGEAPGRPDAMRLHLTVRHHGGTITEALAGCASAFEAVVEVARRFTDDGVGSRGMSVGEGHQDSGRPAGYEASHNLQVVCPDLGRAGQLVDAVAEAAPGRLRVDYVEPFLAVTEEMAALARERAFADARGKADQLAALAGQRVDGVLSVVEGTGGGGPSPLGVARMAAASTTFEPGTAAVTATVTVTWLTSGR
jgi:uncharacterized protein YggE